MLSYQTWQDYHRMLQIMQLRQAAKQQRDSGQWDRLTYRAEQLRSGLEFPRAK